MRGKLLGFDRDPGGGGLIPAHAGKTVCPHPVRLLAGGSSPRMRGKLNALRAGFLRVRLIPAHAGKTLPAQLHERCKPAHPRACGENRPGCAAFWKMWGSSPRMRGKRVFASGARPVLRLIPAHAGKTNLVPTPVKFTWAHPRACGENLKFGSVGSEMEGSSPRMRGKLGGLEDEMLLLRLIPAHAGKTIQGRPSNGAGWAHPRACGENLNNPASSSPVRGSSPRMRGKQRPEALR